jgi:predicted O-methyltransferase YrrM
VKRDLCFEDEKREKSLKMLKKLTGHINGLRGRPLGHLLLWRLGLARAETQTTEAERDCLARHASGKRMLAEIGVYHGVTTCRLRKSMDSSGVLIAIDPYPKQRLGFSAQKMVAHGEVSRIKGGTVKWIRKIGAETARELNLNGSQKFDFVFIDGDHSWEGLQADWEGWGRLIAPGGVVGLHDSRSSPSRQIEDTGSVLFTREVITRDPDFEVVEAVDSLTVLRRRG